MIIYFNFFIAQEWLKYAEGYRKHIYIRETFKELEKKIMSYHKIGAWDSGLETRDLYVSTGTQDPPPAALYLGPIGGTWDLGSGTFNWNP